MPNAERKPNSKLNCRDSKTKRKKKFKDSESNKKKPPTVKPISMPSEPREPWKKPTVKKEEEKEWKQKNNKEFNSNYMKPENNRCSKKKEEWLSKLRMKEMSSKESSPSKNSRENKNSRLKEKDKLFSTHMPPKSVSRSN